MSFDALSTPCLLVEQRRLPRHGARQARAAGGRDRTRLSCTVVSVKERPDAPDPAFVVDGPTVIDTWPVDARPA